MPQSTLGKIAVLLILSIFVLFFVGASSTQLYGDTSAGESILADILTRPIVAVSMLAGFVSAIASFVLSLISILKKKDRAFLVYFALVIGAFLLFFIVGEFISPH